MLGAAMKCGAAVAAIAALLAVCKGCSRFDDVPSRTVLAPVVFEGKPRISHSWTESDQIRYNYTFSVDRVFKGSLPKKDGGGGYRYLVVGVFADFSDKEKCIGSNISLGLTYIVFVNSTAVRKSGKLNVHRITGFPESSTNEIVEDVKKYSRVKNVQLPKARIESGPFVNGTLGRSLQLVCKVTGSPIPAVEWMKEDRSLKQRKGLRIIAIKHGSKLLINKLKDSDLGSFRCQAMNALGISRSSESHISVGSKAHSYPCPNHGYCHNNGTCFIVQSLGIRYCQCNEKFEGKRCQLKKVDLGPVNTDSTFELQYALPVAGVALAALVLTFIAIFIYLGFRSCWQKQKIQKAKELSENSYRPYSIVHQEDSVKSNQGKRRSKPSIPVLKDVSTQTDDFPFPTSSRSLAIVRPDGIPSPHFPSDQPLKNSSDSGKEYSLRRERLRGISATPPDSLAYRRIVHSPVTELISITSDVKDKPSESRVIAFVRSGIEVPLESTEDVAVTEECKRISEYDNCWLEDYAEKHQNNLCASTLTEQNNSISKELSNSDLKKSFTPERPRR